MRHGRDSLRVAARSIAEEVEARRSGSPTSPFVVAIDGPSGSGKSSLAAAVAPLIRAAVIGADDFFSAWFSDADWDGFSPEERAHYCIDWQRLRSEALEPLIQGRRAEWHPFDWEAGPREDGSYGLSAARVSVEPAPVVLVEGAYSSRAELADLFDFTVLVDVPRLLRRARSAARDGPDFLLEWESRWAAAEQFYFGTSRPIADFDFVVDNG